MVFPTKDKTKIMSRMFFSLTLKRKELKKFL